MLNFVPPLPEKKKKREDVDDDEEVRILKVLKAIGIDNNKLELQMLKV